MMSTLWLLLSDVLDILVYVGMIIFTHFAIFCGLIFKTGTVSIFSFITIFLNTKRPSSRF